MPNNDNIHTDSNIFNKVNRLIGLIMCGVAITAMSVSCDDDTATIGMDIMPGTDNVQTSQVEYSVSTRSVKVDSVLANTNDCYLGTIIDPETRAKTTCDFLAQFHMMENYKFPKKEKMAVKDADGNVVADSCDLRIYFDQYYGDSLTTMKLLVQELDKNKVMEEGIHYYTSLKPGDYVNNSPTAIKKSQVYTVRDLTRPDSDANTSTYYRSVVVKLPKEYGSYILNKYYENPDYFKNSYQFIHNVCPGFYVQTTGGIGSMINVEVSTLNVYFQYHSKDAAGNDTIIDGMHRMAATEEVIQNTRIENKIPEDMLSTNSAYTFVKSPTGIFTEVELPMHDIITGTHYNDTINSAQISFRRYNNKEANIYNLSAPEALLLVRKDNAFSFFEKEQITSGGNSYIATFDSNNNAYTFENISQLLTNIRNEFYAEAGVIPGMSDEERKERFEAWIKQNPDRNKMMLIPVKPQYSTTTNSYGLTVKQLLRVRNDLSLSSAKLEGGTTPLKLSVVYSRFAQ